MISKENVIFAVGLAFIMVATSGSAEIKDAESAAHGTDAAQYQIVGSYDYPGLKLIQFDLPVLSHYSYLLVSGGEALVVDPGRDVSVYLDAAKRENAKIRGVYLTHSHADFVAGHVELASQLKSAASLEVPIYISARAKASYPHQALQEGDAIELGSSVVKIVETPGHTPDSTCGLISSKQDPGKPLALLTGDTLFVGSVGRPDLMGGAVAASSLASMLFDTWTEKLSRLPDDVAIFPAHGAGSLCGSDLSDSPSSTIGQERASNPYLRHTHRGPFVAAVLEDLPEAPQYFQHNAAMNRQGPPLVDWKQDKLPWIEPSRDLLDPSKYYVVDVRDPADYSAGHIPNSVAIGVRGRLETWVGIMVPWEANLVLAGDSEQVREARSRLHRVGYEAQCVDMAAWKKSGLPVASQKMFPPRELYARMQSKDSPLVVDVRLPSEWAGLRIGTVINIPLNKLAEESGKLDRSQEVVAVCNSAYRSTMAMGILERAGFKQITSLAGGGEAWIEAGLPVHEARSAGTTGVEKRQIRLAERISASELKRMLMDLPGTFQVVDVRPAEHFADYHIPGSENVELADLLDDPAWLTGAGPLVIVDRDGSLAMMAGGVLSQKTERPIKALYGGLVAYWREAEFGDLGSPVEVAAPAAAPTPAAVRLPAGPSVSPSPAPATKPTAKPKKKSAGC